MATKADSNISDGSAPDGGVNLIIRHNFAKNPTKMKEIGPKKLEDWDSIQTYSEQFPNSTPHYVHPM